LPMWCTSTLKISIQFQHMRTSLVQCVWESNQAKFEPARMILADSSTSFYCRGRTDLKTKSPKLVIFHAPEIQK
jgi:hypothetical protein